MYKRTQLPALRRVGVVGRGGDRTPHVCSGKVHEKAEDSFVSSVLLQEVCQLVSRGRGLWGEGWGGIR